MNRTEKKCIIASAGIHLLLLLILLIGPAFLSSKNEVDDSPVLEFIPVLTTDLKASGGGDPNVKSLPAAQVEPPARIPAPAPAPVQKPVAKPVVPPKEVAKPVPQEKPDSDAVEVTKKPVKPKVNLKLVNRDTNPQDNAKARAEQQAREAVEAQRRVEDRVNRAVSGIKGGLSSSTEIRLKGPGGGGLPYANFLDAVKAAYAREWRVPDGAADDSATATVSVVIARDGTVLSARITRSSGNAAVDRSVQNTLDRVKFAAPLPANAAESQREVSINFNVKTARQLLG
jgi:protein TonB